LEVSTEAAAAWIPARSAGMTKKEETEFS